MSFCQPIRLKHSFKGRAHHLTKLLCVVTRPGSWRPPNPELLGRIQFGCVERSGLHSIGIAGEPAEALRAVKEARCRQVASGLTEYERGKERSAGFGVLFHQTLEGDRDLMDGIGWRQAKQSGESAIGDCQACRCHVLKA